MDEVASAVIFSSDPYTKTWGMLERMGLSVCLGEGSDPMFFLFCLPPIDLPLISSLGTEHGDGVLLFLERKYHDSFVSNNFIFRNKHCQHFSERNNNSNFIAPSLLTNQFHIHG